RSGSGHTPRARSNTNGSPPGGGIAQPVERKNSWLLAQHAEEARPLTESDCWPAHTGMPTPSVSTYAFVQVQVGDPVAALVIDETRFVKQGTTSVAATCRYSGMPVQREGRRAHAVDAALARRVCRGQANGSCPEVLHRRRLRQVGGGATPRHGA